MRCIVASVIFAASVCEGEEIEEKFVGGRAAVLTDTSFVVALMTCVGSTCTPFCSGSLISANVVLTAASCFRPAFSALSDDSLSPTVDSVKVLVGSKSITPIDAGGRLVSVAKIVVSSYGRNVRFPLDGDLALIKLSEPLTEAAGSVEFAKVGTYETEPIASVRW